MIEVICSLCDLPIDGPVLGEPETGWRHPRGCPTVEQYPNACIHCGVLVKQFSEEYWVHFDGGIQCATTDATPGPRS